MMTYKEAVEKYVLSFDELYSAAEQEGVSFKQMQQDIHNERMKLLFLSDRLFGVDECDD